MNEIISGRAHRHGRRLAMVLLTAVTAGCGGGDIDVSQVAEGNVLDGRPSLMRESGEPVTGTVVRRNADQRIVESVEHVDGFPTGWKREWYDDGQLKAERRLVFRNYGRSSGLAPIGTARSYCANGTLQEERVFDEEGSPTGQHRTWTCGGELLTLTSYPGGEYRSATELEDGTVVLVEEGTRDGAGKWQGEHKRYLADGSPALVETWRDGALDGPYQEWDAHGALRSSGSYRAGQRVGTWRTINNGWETVQDHDRSNFVDPAYAGPFMQAAGIRPDTVGWGGKLPLQDARVDLDKLRYYVEEGLVDPGKKLHNGGMPEPFVSSSWTYPYVRASREALPLLVELGADPKAMDSDRRSRLHHCIFSLGDNGVCSPAEIERLIGLGLAVDEPDIGNFTPLLDLVMTSWNWRWAPSPEVQLEVTRLLLDAGANPNKPGGRNTLAPQLDGLTPMLAAAHAKRFELARLLMERSDTPDATHPLGYNVIHLVFLDQQLRQFTLQLKDDTKAFIEYAVSKGVDPGASLGELGTLKEVAQRAGAIDLARYLGGLEGGA